MNRERKNAEGYEDPTAGDVIEEADAERKAFYVMQTFISVARLAGYIIRNEIILEDWRGHTHRQSFVMPKYRHKKDV